MGLILPTESLVLKNCYCLYEISDDVAEIPTLQFIELYHCSSSADDSAYRIQEEQLSIGNDDLVLNLKACVCLIFSALPQQSTKLIQRKVGLSPGMIHQLGFFWEVTMYIHWKTWYIRVVEPLLSKVCWKNIRCR
ncbi:uncharacterized protein LOC124890810 [Capsicum annuum]|uniref:uncharacterized protein LOC124890810 n=1 Tax=Capsicum annuum TaxID=4072 RepID=UPI001FB0E28D|nr:uncharacterized protein LOC124890810 [Capsicum annuum]